MLSILCFNLPIACPGLRHLIWDRNPLLLNNIAVSKSSYILFGATAVTSVLIESLLDNKKI